MRVPYPPINIVWIICFILKFSPILYDLYDLSNKVCEKPYWCINENVLNVFFLKTQKGISSIVCRVITLCWWWFDSIITFWVDCYWVGILLTGIRNTPFASFDFSNAWFLLCFTHGSHWRMVRELKVKRKKIKSRTRLSCSLNEDYINYIVGRKCN